MLSDSETYFLGDASSFSAVQGAKGRESSRKQKRTERVVRSKVKGVRGPEVLLMVHYYCTLLEVNKNLLSNTTSTNIEN